MSKPFAKLSTRSVAVLFGGMMVIVSLLPFLIMILTSVKSQKDLYTISIWNLPQVFHWENYLEIITGNFPVYLFNSLFVVVVSVVLILLVSAMAAYSLVRVGFKGSSSLLGLIIACMAIPVHVTIIPVYLMSNSIGLYDTLFALIGPYVAFGIPMSIFILSDYMRSIPKDLEESARIDGCSYRRIFFKIFFPLSLPGLVSLAIFNGVSLWSEFLFALVLTQSTEIRTLPLGIWEFQGGHQSNVPFIMTFLTLSSLPLIIAYFIGQEKLINGMMTGAIKE
jgi:raffinose/stachyose/melibiose transport system permease protein